ncbi:hypothetical protein E5288_WYG003090 [Bos mutus]|uniref:Uncharacterized protein n=1 Tax=Bos mutus TaxID=72004 RepID=A0A6B0RE36_9CETA|nr:hypothetical protein [Bos mutus]
MAPGSRDEAEFTLEHIHVSRDVLCACPAVNFPNTDPWSRADGSHTLVLFGVTTIFVLSCAYSNNTGDFNSNLEFTGTELPKRTHYESSSQDDLPQCDCVGQWSDRSHATPLLRQKREEPLCERRWYRSKSGAAASPQAQARNTGKTHVGAAASPQAHARNTGKTHVGAAASPQGHVRNTGKTHVGAAASPQGHVRNTGKTHVGAAASPQGHVRNMGKTHVGAAASPQAHVRNTGKTHVGAAASPQGHVRNMGKTHVGAGASRSGLFVLHKQLVKADECSSQLIWTENTGHR